EERYFSHLCKCETNWTETNTLTPACPTSCAAQDEQFNLIFAIAGAVVGILLVLSGMVFDRLGTLITRLLGSVVFLSGSLMVALSTPAISYVLYPAVLCVMYGGFFILVTNIQLGNLLKRG
ncbi:unnamed protein product, partial [Owenia fusiformis]